MRHTFSGNGGWHNGYWDIGCEHGYLHSKVLTNDDIVLSDDVDGGLSSTFTECVLIHFEANLKLC